MEGSVVIASSSEKLNGHFEVLFPDAQTKLGASNLLASRSVVCISSFVTILEKYLSMEHTWPCQSSIPGSHQCPADLDRFVDQ